MSNRTAIVASAAAAGLISIVSITSLTAQTAPSPESKETAAAADQCLAGPKATTPPGGHWYYRLEKGTKRKCWYLGDAGGKVKSAASKPAPADEASAAEDDAPPPPPAKKQTAKSFANARAELRAGAPNEDPSLAETTWPPLPSIADAASHQESPRQDNLTQDYQRQDHQTAAIQPVPQPSSTQGWNIASRWPEPKTVASADAAPAANTPEPAPVLTPDRLAAAAVATPTAAATPAAPVPTNAAAETSDSEMFSIRILLALLVGVLALAAIIGPMIFKYMRPRRREQPRAPGPRRPIWDMDITREEVRQDDPRMPPRTHHARIETSRIPAPRVLDEPRVLDDTADEIEELLSRASKRSAA